MKCVKARKNLIAFDIATDERFKDRGALRAGKRPLNAIVSIGLTQGLSAVLHLCGADLWFSLCDDGHGSNL